MLTLEMTRDLEGMSLGLRVCVHQDYYSCVGVCVWVGVMVISLPTDSIRKMAFNQETKLYSLQ